MRKQTIAILAALFITGLVAMSVAVVGVNAMMNQKGTAVSNSPAKSVTSVSAAPSSDQAVIADLQSQVAGYQAREQQYQTALQSDNQQLAQAYQQIQAVQQLLVYLQNRGIIQINNQGQIVITNGN